MTFQNDMEKMRELYLQTEREFIELSYVIPLDNQSKTYSPRLYNILLGACGQVESMLRLLCKQLHLRVKKRDFPSYYNKLNSYGMLANQKIFYQYRNIEIFPLVKIQRVPDWWDSYNKSKHKLPSGIKQGNIKNTLASLSALYALHIVAFYAQFNPSRE